MRTHTAEAEIHNGRPVRVAHVVLSLDCGGLERVVLDLLGEARRRHRPADVICLERPGALATEAEACGARAFCIGKRPGLRPRAVGRLAAVLRRLRPDVVHTHQIGALFYAGPAALAVGTPAVVHTEHGKHFTGNRRLRLLGRLAGCSASRFFCVTHDLAAEIVAIGVAPRRKVRVVHNGIDLTSSPGTRPADLRRELGIPPTAPVVGTVGRLHAVKCQDRLLRAFRSVQRHLPEAHLLLVGDGPLRCELQSLANELGVGRGVHFAGYQARPRDYLEAMNVFALPSRSEGLPLAALEAGAAGVPVVASRVGGLPELIDDGCSGVLVPPGDEPALAAALTRLLAEPALARSMGEVSRRRVEESFTLGHMAAAYERHYLNVLTRRWGLARCAS